MTPDATSTPDIAAEARHALREAEPWLIWFSRFGYAVKGLVYVLIGVLALQTALGAGGDTTDSQGALRHIAQAPFGVALLITTGVGLVGYALWRFIQAVMDTERKGTALKGLAVRIGYFLVAAGHAGLAVSAFAFVSGGHAGEGETPQAWTARLMSEPYGRWLVGVVGLVVVGYGVSQFYAAVSLKFRDKLKLHEMSETETKWTLRLGCLGYSARGVVFALLGAFLVLAAIDADPREARGLDGALQTLAEQPWGWMVLGTVAFGLTAFGVFMFVEARYRRMMIT